MCLARVAKYRINLCSEMRQDAADAVREFVLRNYQADHRVTGLHEIVEMPRVNIDAIFYQKRYREIFIGLRRWNAQNRRPAAFA